MAQPAHPSPNKPTPVATPDFSALKGKVIVLDADGQEKSVRIEPKTKVVSHNGGYGRYASWTVHGKSANSAQLQNGAFPDLYLRVDGGHLAAGAAQDLTFTVSNGKVTIAGVPTAYTVLDNSKAVASANQDGAVHGVVDWQALDGALICLDAPGKEGNLRVEGKPPATSFKGGEGAFATWEVDFIAPGKITLENLQFDNVYARVVNGHFEASGTGAADATLSVTSNPDGTVSFAGVDKKLTVINNPKVKRAGHHGKK